MDVSFSIRKKVRLFGEKMHRQLELNKFESNSQGPVRLFIIYPKLPKAWDNAGQWNG